VAGTALFAACSLAGGLAANASMVVGARLRQDADTAMMVPAGCRPDYPDWHTQRANPVYGARYQYLTSREHNKLIPTQAQTVIAAAILRHLHAVIPRKQAWDPAIATRGTRHNRVALAA
jgi:hypothetical protein